MKNKIKKFSKGDFRLERPEVVFPETNIIMTIGEGEIYQGSFKIKNKKDGYIRGLIYSSSLRVQLYEEGFEGNDMDISFEYDGRGLKPGHVEHGEFTIVCSGGEFKIPFTAIIEKPYIMTSHGKVQNVRDFKKLAIQDFTEAQRLFRSRDFYEVIKYEEPRVRALYDNMRKWSLSEQAMEEFLVGIKQKECIFLTMAKSQRTFRNLKEATKEIIHFTKNTWGYMPVRVHVDGDFIQVARNQFTTEDFVGNLFDFSYIIHPEKIHAGNNYGRIIFESPYESLTYEILVTDHKDHPEGHRDTDILIATLMKGFLSSMAGITKVEEWADEVRSKLEGIDIYTGEGNVYPLIDAQLCILCKDYEKADSILDGYAYNKHAMSKEPIVTSYYLYLTALIKKTGSHVNRVVEEINKAYMKRPKSWQLVCMLVDIDPEYKNYSKRLQVLERHYLNGANQILLYWQAFCCFLDHPTSLKKLTLFEIQILNFAVKYKLLTKEIALYTANLATQQRTYDKFLDTVLKKIYEMYKDPQILAAICTLMIRGNRTDAECFEWYEKAVEEDLKIAQLYEYYMMAVSEKQLKKEFPKSVYLYFMHGNTLTYRKAAILYANMILFQDESSELYGAYREQMERFAWEQLEQRRINEPLRIIYKRCCTQRDMTEEREKAIYDLCHAYEIKTTKKNMSYILVLNVDGTITQRVPVNPEGTIVYMYSKDTRIVWESKEGRHYVDSFTYEIMRLLYESRFVEICRKFDQVNEEEERRRETKELTWKNLKELGTEIFEDEAIFRLCSMRIREEGYEEDEFLSMLCYKLFEKDLYDKVTLTYLTEHYCGATLSMKKLWHVARVCDITTYKLSERIITQMLFSEMMFGEEEIFSDYYEGRTYFRLKQAYLAYVSREYVVNGRQVKGCIFAIIANEYRKEEELADICKIALLKYYSSREVHQELEPMLREYLREMCEKQLYFSFYLNYPENWLREVQLYDKTMLEYHGKPGSKVEISYRIEKHEKDKGEYQCEVLLPSYEDTYIKTLVLFCDESVRYFFKEVNGEEVVVTEKRIFKPEIRKNIGRYGRLNEMISLKGDELNEKMQEFRIEKELADEIFVAY